HLELHARLEEDDLGPLEQALERLARRALEGDVRAVDRVELAVVEARLDVDERHAEDAAALAPRAEALLDRRTGLARVRAADDVVDVLERVGLGVVLELDVDDAVLAAAARLLDVLAFDVDRAADRLLVGDLRGRSDDVDFVLAAEAREDDLEVE